jgi:riboflavin biosynthesis protein RibD
MQEAINEALKAEPNKVYPNPRVGCVIVLNDKNMGRGYHKAFGTKQAEVKAIESLEAPVKEAELYVTLEPCAHFGNNPPGVDAIIKSKRFKKVIMAVAEPNKKARGGIDELKKANIEVEGGDSQKEAKKINQRVFTFFENKRPYIILKYARTQEGFIAHSEGSSKGNTEEEARRDVHLTRAGCDGNLVGRKTKEQENPSLDSQGLGKDPRIVILSSKPLSSSLKVSKKTL